MQFDVWVHRAKQAQGAEGKRANEVDDVKNADGDKKKSCFCHAGFLGSGGFRFLAWKQHARVVHQQRALDGSVPHCAPHCSCPGTFEAKLHQATVNTKWLIPAKL
jgi:hypothetical protein